MDFIIGPATAQDAAAIAALLKSAFTEFEALYTPEAFAATVLSPAAIFTRLAEGPLWIARSKSLPIGAVGAVRSPDSVLVRGMAVAPSARGLGAGKLLLDQVEHFARQQSVSTLALYTTNFLDRAICLYRASGFAFTGDKANPHGTELLRMVKVLTL